MGIEFEGQISNIKCPSHSDFRPDHDHEGMLNPDRGDAWRWGGGGGGGWYVFPGDEYDGDCW